MRACRTQIRRALPEAKITNEQIERMFRIGDLDNSGQIDFVEFSSLFDDIVDEQCISLKALAERWIGFSATVQDPEMIFQLAWRQLAVSGGGEEQVQLPRACTGVQPAPRMRRRGLQRRPKGRAHVRLASSQARSSSSAARPAQARGR